jgi:neutral ceramidase
MKENGMMEQLFCGAAKEKITPPENLLPDLYGLGNLHFGEVLDDIYVRVILLASGSDKALLVCMELDKAPYPQQMITEISRKTGIPEECIFYLSIHSHCSPVTGDRPFEIWNDKSSKTETVRTATLQYEELLKKAIFRAVDEAVGKLQPAKLGTALGTSGISVNRNQDYVCTEPNGSMQVKIGLGVNPDQAVDPSLFVMKMESMDGKPLAFFINYAVHNDVMIGNHSAKDGNAVITGDLGGRVSAYTEEKYPGSVAMWTSGAAGDVNPVMLNEFYYPDPRTGEQRRADYRQAEIPLMMLQMMAARHFADVVRTIRRIGPMEAQARIAAALTYSETPGRDIAEHNHGQAPVFRESSRPYKIRLHLLKIGDTAFLGIGGELYSSMGMTLKAKAPCGRLVIMNHEASMLEHCGYILDDDAIERCEKGGSIPGWGESRITGGTVEKSLTDKMLELFQKIQE